MYCLKSGAFLEGVNSPDYHGRVLISTSIDNSFGTSSIFVSEKYVAASLVCLLVI